MNSKIILVVILILIIVAISFLGKEHLTDLNRIEIQKQIDINLKNYNTFMQQRSEIDKLLKKYNEDNNTNIEYGYGILKKTDKTSLGFCPLGQYYESPSDSEFVNEPKNFDKCKECKNCLEKPGYYLSNGCLGDQDSECTFGSLPNEIYLKVHKEDSLFHKGVYPQHQHTFEDGTLSTINHTH
jgi:hypothetical protein